MPLFIGVKEAAEILGVSAHTIYRMIERKEIITMPKKGPYRIPKSQFDIQLKDSRRDKNAKS